ncbi:stromal membrane-associated protein 1 [Magnaporthiopsis poae ATCC 64411]|uniref:Stromal membrane-associated protein 1 n=1 Tax=Magnaporthiopsis poae (strain ATCC 64411 / 73-15) TaxID=644358 RepID=A0A0C4DZ95_MAGP6|nr:stromal membrane-associated protein 1 [Magnaporthiopsis poae ATCC 64411]
MSRRAPNPAAERAAQNQQTIKSLLKLEANKICADCKRNKHPRWASWNLGVFICIRCSGIHRGMGTHISRVKSVDLDSWTDEQLQSILSWGNARANKYWEFKLAPGHAPSEAKIENFIRTKYELKRWVMEGGIPDPATLDAEADDDIPLSIVKEKQNIDKKEAVRKASIGQSAAPRRVPAPPAPQEDLIGGDPIPQRASSASPSLSKVPAKAEAAPPKTSTRDSLLGLDFLGNEPVAPPRPSSASPATTSSGGQSRPDLKQSILSLYATAPRPQPAAQQPAHGHTGSFGGMQSPTFQQQSGGGGMSGMSNAFSNLSFGPTSATQKSPVNDAFAGLSSISARSPPPPQQSSAFSGLGGGSFFDAKPAAAAQPSQQQKSSFSGFDAFGSSATSAPASKPAVAPVPASSALGDLFDFASPAPATTAAKTSQPAPMGMSAAAPAASSSVFNLSSQNKSPPATMAAGANPMAAAMGSSSAWSNSDVWGNDNAWASSKPAAAPSQPASGGFGGWGDSTTGGSSLAGQSIVPGASGGFQPKVSADEEFGGWASSTGGNAKPAGGFGATGGSGGNGDDLFSNVWQ